MTYTLINGLCYINGAFVKKNITIENEKIVLISDDIVGKEINVDGCIVAGSFIDPHVHMREPGYTHKATIKTESYAAAHGGYTTCFLMPNLKPVPSNKEVLDLINNIIKTDSKIDLHQIASITADQTGLGTKLSDMEEIKDLCVGYSDDGNGVVDANTMYNAMKIAAKLNKPIISHSEDKSIVNHGVVCLGEYGKNNNLPMIDPVSEAVEAQRNALLAYKTGCHLHICHVSSIDTVEACKFYKSKGANITLEVTPHQLVLNDTDIKSTNYKMNPPLSTKSTSEYLLSALLNGDIDCIATDHAPHSKEEKAKDFISAPFGITGLETAFPVLYTKLVKEGKMTLEQLLDCLNKRVANAFGIKENVIELGANANLVVIDLNNEYEINEDFFMSKALNSPFVGWKVYGEIKKTIYKGDVVYEK